MGTSLRGAHVHFQAVGAGRIIRSWGNPLEDRHSAYACRASRPGGLGGKQCWWHPHIPLRGGGEEVVPLGLQVGRKGCTLCVHGVTLSLWPKTGLLTRDGVGVLTHTCVLFRIRFTFNDYVLIAPSIVNSPCFEHLIFFFSSFSRSLFCSGEHSRGCSAFHMVTWCFRRPGLKAGSSSRRV